MSLSGWNRERIKYIRWWSHDKVLFEFIFEDIDSIWFILSAEALSTQVVTASCGFACRIILLCKAHCAAWRKTEKDQTTTNTSRTKYIQLYPTIMFWYVLSISLSLSPCCSCTLTHWAVPQDLHRLLLPTHSCPISSSISYIGCGWRFMTRWQLWCSRSFTFTWEYLPLSVQDWRASIRRLRKHSHVEPHFLRDYFLLTRMMFGAVSCSWAAAMQWPVGELKSSHPWGMWPAPIESCNMDMILLHSTNIETDWESQNVKMLQPVAEAARFQMLAIVLGPQTWALASKQSHGGSFILGQLALHNLSRSIKTVQNLSLRKWVPESLPSFAGRLLQNTVWCLSLGHRDSFRCLNLSGSSDKVCAWLEFCSFEAALFNS